MAKENKTNETSTVTKENCVQEELLFSLEEELVEEEQINNKKWEDEVQRVVRYISLMANYPSNLFFREKNEKRLSNDTSQSNVVKPYTLISEVDFTGYFGALHEHFIDDEFCIYCSDNCRVLKDNGECDLANNAYFQKTGESPEGASCRDSHFFFTMCRVYDYYSYKDAVKECEEYLLENLDKVKKTVSINSK